MSEERTSALWWPWSAGLIAALMAVFAIGNLVEDDGGPLYGKVLLAAVLLGGAGLVTVGLLGRRRGASAGNRLIGIGVLPGSLGIAFIWFPPAVIVGITAIITAVAAFRETTEVAASQRVTLYTLVAVFAALAILGSGLA